MKNVNFKTLSAVMLSFLFVLFAVASGNKEAAIDDEELIINDAIEIPTDAIIEFEDEADIQEDAKNDNSIPWEYTAALNKAYSYSDTLHMSKAGIYDQLVSEYGEGFSEDAAQYAIDNIVADWNKNALEKAKDYSELNMSKAGIYEQLISAYGEQFTEDEAQYAVDNLKADYKANALNKAKAYRDMDMSPSAIYDQLVSYYGEQFTPEEAQYAIDNLV